MVNIVNMELQLRQEKSKHMKTIRFSPSLAKGWLLTIMLMMGVEVAMADAGTKKLCAYVASDTKSMTLVFCNPDDAPPSGYSRYVYDGGNNWNSSFHETVKTAPSMLRVRTLTAQSSKPSSGGAQR